MKSFAQFKQENGLTKIDLLQGKGRMYAKVGSIDLIVGKETKLDQPLYVIHGVNEAGQPQPFHTLVNSANVKIAATI